MQSRSRKYRKSFDSYQQAIEKQLNDDFQVYEYLNQNHLEGNNIDQYLKLYDCMLVTKNNKKKKFESLQVNYVQMTSQNYDANLQTSQVQNWGGSKQYFLTKYQQTQINTSNQIEVKNNLWKEILQTKKSLNLLKGDIGHLVGRNQSANLLQSKISKVKIVADDQLKRVSLAYVKDKDELKLRRQMQNKFNKKLKNVSMFEDTTLNRLKRNYLDTMVKKKQIHDRLNYIQKVGASINESSDKQRLKNQINKNTLELFNNFQKLSNLITKVPEIQLKYGYSSDQIHQFVNWLKNQQNYTNTEQFKSNNHVQTKQINLTKSNIKGTKSRIQTVCVPQINSQDLEMITQQKLINFEQIIIKQQARIMQQIQNQISCYDMQMKKSQQIVVKLQRCNQQIEKIQLSLSNQMGMKYILTKQMREQYSSKLRRLINFLKTIFVLLQYIQKNLNYTNFSIPMKKRISTESQKSSYNNQKKQKKKPHSDSLKMPTQTKIIIPSDKSLSWNNKNYISELYTIYFMLLKDQEQNHKIQNIESSVFYELQHDIQSWLHLIKQYFKNGKQIKKHFYPEKIDFQSKSIKAPKNNSKIRDSRISQIKVPNTGNQTEDQEMNQIKQENQYNFQNYKRHHTVYREDNISRYHSYSSSSGRSTHMRYGKSSVQNRTSMNFSNPSTPNLINVKKLKNCSQHQKKAQRIQFLQDVDKDYYKMLKSTLTMQKQNTRKNYQFLRTFKRAKYSSRDQILEEKRFQCSFSMLFAGKNTQKISEKRQTAGKKSIFFKNENLQKRISRLNESRRLLQSSKLIKSIDLSQSGVDFNDKTINQLKQNVRKIKDKGANAKSSILKNKHSLSIQMKDIINLV